MRKDPHDVGRFQRGRLNGSDIGSMTLCAAGHEGRRPNPVEQVGADLRLQEGGVVDHATMEGEVGLQAADL